MISGLVAFYDIIDFFCFLAVVTITLTSKCGNLLGIIPVGSRLFACKSGEIIFRVDSDIDIFIIEKHRLKN